MNSFRTHWCGQYNPQLPLSAMANIKGSPAYSGIHGFVHFAQTQEGVAITADIYGLPETLTGFFAFHMHEGICSHGDSNAVDSFPDTGGHYNPENKPHPQHAGDFPPLLRTGDGTAHLAFDTDRFDINQAIGRAVIIHINPDDFKTQPSGDAGEKIACGVISPAKYCR